MSNIQLWEHQRQAVLRAKDKNFFGFLFEQGCGKTLTLIKVLEDVFTKEHRVLPTLILCPVAVGVNWERELKKFSSIPHDRIFNACGVRYARADKLSKLLAKNRDMIVICNYEVASSLQTSNVLVKNWKPEVLVCDESHKIKNYRAARTKYVMKLAKQARYRYILTGTPFTNSLMDIWSQLYILDHGERLGKAFWDFRRVFFEDHNSYMPRESYFPDWQPKSEKTPTHIAQLMDDCTMAVKKDECMDLPPLVKQQLYVRMHARQTTLYNQIEKDAVAFIEQGVMSADLVITKLLRMLQIASGFAVLDNGVVTKAAPVNPKILALAEIMDAIPNGEKMIIWCNFHEEIRMIKRLLIEHDVAAVELHGGIPQDSRQRNIDIFNDLNHPCRILIANPQAGGIGINLVAAKYAIFFSRGYSLEVDQQAEARNYRGGSEIHDKIVRIDIIAKDTVEEVVYQALADKKDVAESVLGYWSKKRGEQQNEQSTDNDK